MVKEPYCWTKQSVRCVNSRTRASLHHCVMLPWWSNRRPAIKRHSIGIVKNLFGGITLPFTSNPCTISCPITTPRLPYVMYLQDRALSNWCRFNEMGQVYLGSSRLKKGSRRIPSGKTERPREISLNNHLNGARSDTYLFRWSTGCGTR